MSLIHSYHELKQFIEKIVPEPTKTEVYFVQMIARRKYYKELSRNSIVLDHMYAKKNDLLQKLRRFLRVDDYDFIDKKTGKPIPKTAIAVYIDLYPKDTIKWLTNIFSYTSSRLSDMIFNSDRDYVSINNVNRSVLATSHRRKPVRIVDIDLVNEKPCQLNELLADIDRYGLPKPNWVTKTRGGWHLIYKTENSEDSTKICKKIHNAKLIVKNVEYNFKNGQTVLCGTLQGGYEVYGWKIR